jgi:hypothetical protein
MKDQDRTLKIQKIDAIPLSMEFSRSPTPLTLL